MRLKSLLPFVVAATVMAGTPCFKEYQSGTSYITNSLVSHNGKNYQAEWGTANEPGTTNWDGWNECGECDEREPLEFQTAWPPYEPVEGGVQAGTRVSFNGRNYVAAYPTVEHPTNPSAWSDAGPCIVPIDGELGSFKVDDNRKYASCQNYADGGRFYEFRISQSGELHYWIDDEYIGIFSFDDEYNTSSGTHYEVSDEGTKFQMPALSMVAADNNRVIVKAKDSKKTFWAALVDEYPHDFALKAPEAPHDPASVSVPGHFSIVNPEYGKDNYSVPSFPSYPYVHFGTSNFYNPIPLTNDGLKEFFGDNFKFKTKDFDGNPDLADVVKKNTKRLFEDAMGVAVIPGHFYEIGANPPRNNVDLLTSEMTDEKYKEIVYKAWTESFSSLLDVLKEEMVVPNQQDMKDMIKKQLDDAYHIGQYPNDGKNLTQEIWDYELSAAQRGALDLLFGKYPWSPKSKWGAWDEINMHITHIIGKFKQVVQNIDMNNYVDMVDYMHLEVFEMWRDHGYDYDVYESIMLDVAGKVLREIITDIDVLEEEHSGISTIRDEVRNGIRKQLKEAIISSGQLVGSIAMKMDDENQASPESAAYWVKLYSDAWHNYYHDLKAPGTYFGLKDTLPYHYQTDWNKQKLDIIEIYDVGVGNPHRYEHARKHNGGDLQNFFKEFTVEEYKTTTLTDGTDWTSFVDGNGYNDGTCNFYMLAKIRVASDGSETPDQENIAVLWLDEQEYFSERWRVAHPLDAMFEGLTGNLLNMFPVLAWEDAADLPDFVRSYWAPFMEPGLIDEKSRMANSRYAVVVSGVDELFTTSFFWATSDSTWRARRYPNLNPDCGEYLDRSSLQIRDDQTIYMAGKKSINGKITQGYFYQRLVPNSNVHTSTPTEGSGVYGAKPELCEYDWRFVEKAAFEVAHQKFFRMGTFDATKNELPEEAMGHDVYNFRGYNPRVHVMRCDNNISVPNNALLQLFEKDGTPYLHPMYKVAKDWNEMDSKPVNTEVVLPKVNLRAIQVPFLGQTKTYLTFADRRNDDLGAFLVNEKTLNIDVKDYTYDLKYNGQKVGTISSGYKASGVNNVTDLNVWSDAPIESIDFATNVVSADVTDETFAGAEATRQNDANPDLSPSNYAGKTYVKCQFDMPRNPSYFADATKDIPARTTARYIFKTVKIGIIEPETGESNVVATFNIANTNISNPHDATCYGWANLSSTEWQNIRDNYLSETGLVKYATSIWADDYFGNGNTFTLTNDIPVDTIVDTTVTITKNIGVVNSAHYIQPGITKFTVDQFPNWNFKSAVFGISGIINSLEGEIYVNGVQLGTLSGWYKAYATGTTGQAPIEVEIRNRSEAPFYLQWWVNVNH